MSCNKVFSKPFILLNASFFKHKTVPHAENWVNSRFPVRWFTRTKPIMNVKQTSKCYTCTSDFKSSYFGWSLYYRNDDTCLSQCLFTCSPKTIGWHCQVKWEGMIRNWCNQILYPTNNTHSMKQETAGKHLRAKMTSAFLYLYSKKQEWWGIVQRKHICIAAYLNMYQCYFLLRSGLFNIYFRIGK